MKLSKEYEAWERQIMIEIEAKYEEIACFIKLDKRKKIYYIYI